MNYKNIIIGFISLIALFSFSKGQNIRTQNEVMKKVESSIIKYTGEEFYYNNYKLLSMRYFSGSPECKNCSEYMKHPYYSITWKFKIKGKEFINEKVGFNADTCGNLVKYRRRSLHKYYPEGFPDCLNYPEKCKFSIDSIKAISIAKSYGFDEGLEKWKINFYWYGGDILNYVWGIENTLKIFKDGRRKGKSIIIDANDGKIIKQSFWGST